MDRDPVADARDLVTDLFPHGRWAMLTGSVITSHRTAGSDLDIVVVLPDGDPQAPHRQSRTFRGWPVELLVHDEQTLTHYLAKDLPARRPILHQMVATGTTLVGDPDPWPARCAKVLAGGPTPLTGAERERIRYALTDLLDDLVHATDPGERTVIAATAWVSVAQQRLALADRWIGHGKWLVRELRRVEPDFTNRWLAASGVPGAIEELLREVLDGAGGPLFDGYHAAGERPT